MAKLSESEIKAALPTAPEWEREGPVIRRAFTFPSFLLAVEFVNTVADLAERVGHHPDIDIRWNRVTLALTTHDEGGLTAKDFALARQFDEIAD